MTHAENVSRSPIELFARWHQNYKKDFGSHIRGLNHMSFAKVLTALSALVLFSLVAFTYVGMIVFVTSVRF
jgi:hypothetical protein